MSRAVDLAFRKTFRLMEKRTRAFSRANLKKPYRLRESEELQSYNSMISSAIQFFETKQDESVQLPPDSPEKMTIEAVMGVLNQFRISDTADNDTIREKANLLADKLRSMFEGKSSDGSSSGIAAYVTKLREGMTSLHNSISPGGGELETPDLGAGEGDDELAGPGSEPGAEPEPEPDEPEIPEEEGSELAKKLGLQ